MGTIHAQRWLIALAALFALAGPCLATPPTAEEFTRRQNVWSASLSPDGRSIATIKSVEAGDALVVLDWRTRQAKAIQIARADRSLHLDWVAWKTDTRLLFELRQRAVVQQADATGSNLSQGRKEEFDVTRVFAVNIDGTGLTQMFEGQTRRMAADFAPVSLISAVPNDPENVLLGTYGRRGYSLFRASVTTGRVQEIATGSWETDNFVVDGVGDPVIRTDWLPDNKGYQIFRRAPGQNKWELAHEIRRATVTDNREFDVLGPGAGPGKVYVAARPPGREYQAIYLYDTSTGELGAPVFANDQADVSASWFNRTDNSLMIGCVEKIRTECRATDPGMQRHFEAINTFFGGAAAFSLRSASRDGAYWLISANGPTIPDTFYVYDVANAHLEAVLPVHPQILASALSPTQVVNYTARDGTALWGYLTVPPNATRPMALVVMPHGGPQARDSYGYDFYVQFLASRGYAVFQPNFRGSEGSGRAFAQAGYRQWGRLMQDDVTDGVRQLIQTGAADAKRICIVGISYGGYAALAGVSLTPDLYRCAISIAGDSDLIELLDLERQSAGRTAVSYAYWRETVGDANADRDALAAVSPRRLIDKITAPVLLIHGTDDRIVFPRQSTAMRDALAQANKSVRYVEISDESHPWRNWRVDHVRSVFEESERFLAQNLAPR